MGNEGGKRLKRGLELVHPANHGFYRQILAELPRARLSGNFRRMTLLNTVLLTLEKYPLPIRCVQDAVMLAGVGDLTVMSFESTFKKHGIPKATREQCVAHAEKVLTRLRTFLHNTDFSKEPGVTSCGWRPSRYSNAWTFIMVLGLYSDMDDNGKLTIDDIVMKADEIKQYIPKCKLGKLNCIRVLIERGLVEFVPPAPRANAKQPQENGVEIYNNKRKRRYKYGLTECGKRLAADIISKCEVPISLKPRVSSLASQVTMTLPASQDDIEILSDSSLTEDEFTDCTDSGNCFDSDEYLCTITDARLTSEITAFYPARLHKKGVAHLCTPHEDTAVRTSVHDDLDALALYRCNDPSQYVGSPPLKVMPGPSETVPDVISIADSDSSKGTSDPVHSFELHKGVVSETDDAVISKSQHSISDTQTTAHGGPMSTLRGLTDDNGNPYSKDSRGSVDNFEFDDMVAPIALDNSMYDTSPINEADEERYSDGFRTPATSRLSIKTVDDISRKHLDISLDRQVSDTHSVPDSPNKKELSLLSISFLSEVDNDPHVVSSDRYRKLMDACEEAPHCYSQWGNDSDGHVHGYGSSLIKMHNSNDGSSCYKMSCVTDGIFLDEAHDDEMQLVIAPNPQTATGCLDSSILVNEEPSECINIHSDDDSSHSSSSTPLCSLSPMTSPSFRHFRRPGSAGATCNRFLPLSQRLKHRYGIDMNTNMPRYEVITVVDNREVHDADGRYQRRVTEIFADAGKTVVFRQLPLGDVIWLLRYIPEGVNSDGTTKSPGLNALSLPETDHAYNSEHGSDTNTTQVPNMSRLRKGECTNSHKGDELAECFVLDWVVERKTTADLMASIADGRYEDQKLRMLRLIGFKHVCYLFEDIEAGSAVGRVSSMNKGVNAAAIASARIHTQLVTGFNVIRTTGMSHTASNILIMHNHIERCVRERIRDVAIMSEDLMYMWLKRNFMKYRVWDVRNRRQNQMTFLELFGKQLRSIPGCGAATTQAILEACPTPFMFSQELKTSNMAYINELLMAHLTKKKRAPVSNNLYATFKNLYVKNDHNSSRG